MGFHVCEYCRLSGEANPDTSSGDVTLAFDNGRVWVMPDMILHYIADHGFVPPDDFMGDVLKQKFIAGGRAQTKSATEPIRVGYLNGRIDLSRSLAPWFFMALWSLMEKAKRCGDRRQTRGIRQ